MRIDSVSFFTVFWYGGFCGILAGLTFENILKRLLAHLNAIKTWHKTFAPNDNLHSDVRYVVKEADTTSLTYF